MRDASELTAKVYDQIADVYASKFNKPSEYIDDFLEFIPEGGKILDAGCGPGVDSAHMAGKGFRVVGIDLSAGMVQSARDKNPEITFQQADIRNLNFDPKSFDGILASYSLVHVPKSDLSAVLEGFFNILKSTGAICFGVQEGESKEVYVTEPFKPTEKIFLNVMSKEEFRTLLEKNHFRIVQEFIREAKNQDGFELHFNKFVVIAKKEAG